MITVENYKEYYEPYLNLNADDKIFAELLYTALTDTLKDYKRNIIEEILFLDTIIEIIEDLHDE